MKLVKWFVLIALAVVLCPAVLANPIPWPLPASMPLEDMYAFLDEVDSGGLRETFYGDYYFSYIPSDLYMMKYPLPPDSDGISVAMGKLPEGWQFDPASLPFIHEMAIPRDPIHWYYIRELYPTVVPEWPGIPMIAWRGWCGEAVPAEDAPCFPKQALFSVKYQHNLLQRGHNRYVYFYALGTGKYYETYQKQAISFLDVSMPVTYNMDRLFLDHTPHAFAVTTERDANGRPRSIVSVYATAQFGPFTKDIIGHVRPWYVTADANHDDATNILDLIAVRNQLGRDPSTDSAASDADVDGDGRVTITDLILVRNHLGEKPEVDAACPPQIRLRYRVASCGSSQPPPGIKPDVIPWGRRMIVTDQIEFNCCKEYIRMTILVNGSRVIFREKAMESAPCDCICWYPMKGTAGPFAPGTYEVELIDPYGKTKLSKTITIH